MARKLNDRSPMFLLCLFISVDLIILCFNFLSSFCAQQFYSHSQHYPQSGMSKQKAPEPPKKYQSKHNEPKVQVKRETEVEKYMKQLSTKTLSLGKATKQIEQGEKSILKSIKKGKLEIKQVPNDLGMILIKQKIDEEQKKANQLRRKREEILEAIQKLDMRSQKSSQSFKTIGKQYSNPDLLNYKPNSVLTREEHEAMVEKIKNAQQIQDQRNQERLYRLQKRYQQETQKLQKLEQQKINSQKQLRKRRSQYKLSLRQQINQLQNAQQLRSRKELLALKKKNHLHEILEQKYNNTMVVPVLEEKKKKLREIRELNKSFKIKELNEHQKKYIKERNKSMHLLNSKVKISQEWTYKPPERTEKLSKILEEELSEQKKELQKHQKAVEEKILRQDNYIRILKQKHIPKIDQNKQKELEHRIDTIHTKRRQPTIDTKEAGKNYLIEAKKMKKNLSQTGIREASEVVEASPAPPQLQSLRVNYLIRSDDNQYYAEKRKENLQKIIQSEKGATEKAHQLQVQNKKIEEAYKRKQELLKIKSGSPEMRKDAAELLLSAIKAKMGLIKLAQ